jgi:protein TonB
MYHYRSTLINRHSRIFLAIIFAFGLHAFLLQTDFQFHPANLQLDAEIGRPVTITLVPADGIRQNTEEFIATPVAETTEQSRSKSDPAAVEETFLVKEPPRQEKSPGIAVQEDALVSPEEMVHEPESPIQDYPRLHEEGKADSADFTEKERLESALSEAESGRVKPEVVPQSNIQPAGDTQNAESNSTLAFRNAEPLYKVNPPPPYPGLARKRGYEGLVLLEVFVTDEGNAQAVRVGQSSGYPILDRSAVKAVSTWHFLPGMQSGKPVETWVMVPVRFELK